MKDEEKKDSVEETPEKEPEKKDEDLSNLSEEDVASLMDAEKKIPYKVFQERNAKLRDAERELRTLREAQKALEEKQVQTPTVKRQPQQPEKDDYMDFGLEEESGKVAQDSVHLEELESLKGEISSLKSYVNEMKEEAKVDSLKREFKDLKTVYPHADEALTMALKMRKPSWTLEECAEYSHNRTADLVQSKVQDLIRTKKEQMQKTKEVSPRERIAKEYQDKRPKSFEEILEIAPELIS